jgi:hypothetical protein
MIFKNALLLCSTLRNPEIFSLFKVLDDSSWPRNANSWLAEEHTASINRRNIHLFFFHFFAALGDVVFALSVEKQVNPLLFSK